MQTIPIERKQVQSMRQLDAITKAVGVCMAAENDATKCLNDATVNNSIQAKKNMTIKYATDATAKNVCYYVILRRVLRR